MAIPLTPVKAGVSMAVRVVPRGGRTGIAGVRGDALLVRLAAAPVDGAANDALIHFLAEIFHLPTRDVTLVAGHRSRTKRVTLSGLTEAAVAARLAAILSQ